MKSIFGFFALAFLFLSCQSNDLQNNESGKVPNFVFLIADDWSYPHAGVYGDPVVQTPTFDFLAENGALFENAFCAAPSCSPSRAAILTSRYPHQMESAGNLWSVFPDKFSNWVTLLAQAGYLTGKKQKGWGPGDFERGGYQHNPAGKNYGSFAEFLLEKKEDQPFCFWFGSSDPHRDYETNTGIKTGMSSENVVVPEFLPDLECVRNDILDYFFEIERFDRECGQIMRKLEEIGELHNTFIIMTSDNGMPFPRAKANLYDFGTRMPLVIFWQGQIQAGTEISEFVNFIDFGPTIVDVAQLDIPIDFSGRSLVPLLRGLESGDEDWSRVYLERERHANVRAGDLGYPCRAIRTENYLYIQNFETDRWPAGDPSVHQSVGQYGDVDNSISKFLIMEMEMGAVDSPLDYFELTFGKRPSEELYHIESDPYNLRNLASLDEHQETLSGFRIELDLWMAKTNDLRALDANTNYWDTVEYTPTYQRQNFNLEAEISNYKMLRSLGAGRFESIDCN